MDGWDMDCSASKGPPPCCATASAAHPGSDEGDPSWVIGRMDTPVGQVARVATRLLWPDRIGALRVRLNIRRMHYAVTPGLYAVGNPTPESPVLVSANYKLSFDGLRRELGGVDAWIMVLDTKGINVWCAAGKGTFGTQEIIRRIEATGLAALVVHRTLILPQLGAPGVAAHQVQQQCGFRVVYGPVCARDIPSFLRNRMRTTPDMRRVRFNWRDRLVVVPVELVQEGRHVLLLAAGLLLLAGLGRGGYDSARAVQQGGRAVLLVLAAFLGGGVVAPLLLPWLPGRAFSGKGAVVGLALAGAAILAGGWDVRGTGGWLEASAWFLMMPAIAAFMAMNFTGASTYTSMSGVKKEMRFAVPMLVVAGTVGIGLWMAARFLA